MVIVTGQNGFIASRLLKFLREKMKHHHIIGTTRNKTDENSIQLDLKDISKFDSSVLNEGDILIHTAAISSPDQCQNNYEEVYNVNVINTIELINRCIKRKVKVLFFSSDTVYGEKYNAFDESETLAPLGSYAKMKAEVEKKFLCNPQVKVFHLSYVFEQNDKYMNYLMECYAKGEKAEVFAPFDRSIVYIQDVLEAVFTLILKWNNIQTNCINICGPQLVSREMLTQCFSNNINSGLDYKVITPKDDFYKARPRVINMHSKYFEKLLGRPAHDIDDAMKIELRDN